jgi:hypothetical protein
MMVVLAVQELLQNLIDDDVIVELRGVLKLPAASHCFE